MIFNGIDYEETDALIVVTYRTADERIKFTHVAPIGDAPAMIADLEATFADVDADYI